MSATEERRIFICYPRAIIGDVETFHDALRERLGFFGRNYEIFRDVGPDKHERIETGKDWKKVLRQKLEASRCCLIVLIPAIFQSVECAEEVEYFKSLIDKDPNRFFYPVDFADINDAIEDYKASGNVIAGLLAEGHLHRFPFANTVLVSDTKAYKREVQKIAEEIDGRFSAKKRPPRKGAAAAGDVTVVPPEVPTRKKLLGPVLGGLAAALVIAAIAVYWLLPPAPPPPRPAIAWSDVTAPIELVLPTQSFASFGSDAAEAALLDPGSLAAGSGDITGVREATIDGKVWYEIKFGNGETRYLPKDSLPVWREAEGNLEIVRPVEALAGPYDGAETVETLAPGDLAKRQEYGPLREAKIGEETWFRVPQRQDADVYFALGANRAKLAQWTALSGCLTFNQDTRSLREPADDASELNSYYKSQELGPDAGLQEAEIDGAQWFRFQETPEAGFEYLPAAVVTKSTCSAG